jgi:hypothetical protein
MEIERDGGRSRKRRGWDETERLRTGTGGGRRMMNGADRGLYSRRGVVDRGGLVDG